jgi:hypothetical protein
MGDRKREVRAHPARTLSGFRVNLQRQHVRLQQGYVNLFSRRWDISLQLDLSSLLG